jgi:hypothetical protein
MTLGLGWEDEPIIEGVLLDLEKVKVVDSSV